MLSSRHRRQLLKAERTQHVGTITAAIDAILKDEPTATPLDVEMVFREATTNTYLIATDRPGEYLICFGGLANLLAQLALVETTLQTNRAALALTPDAPLDSTAAKSAPSPEGRC
jgi:hypothetical protein